MQLLYGPNTGQSNNGCYESKAFDALYEKSLTLPARLAGAQPAVHRHDAGRWKSTARGACMSSPMRNQLIRPWVKGYKKHPILQAEFVYMDVDVAGGGRADASRGASSLAA